MHTPDATQVTQVLATANLRLNAGPIDYVLIASTSCSCWASERLARRSVSTSLDFFLSGRSMPAWVTGLAFISANLGAVEIFGMTANGAQFGVPTVHYYWIGAIPAMVFLGLVMMPFYYGSKVRSVPEFLLRRFGPATHLVNGISFAVAQVLIAGINLYALATVVNLLLGWPLWLSIVIAAAIVLAYTTLGGLSGRDLQRGHAVLRDPGAADPADLVGLDKVGGWSGLVDKMQQSATQAHLNANDAAALLAGHEPHRHRSPMLVRAGHRVRAWVSCCPSVTGRRTSPRCSARCRRRTCRPPGGRR